MEVTSNNKAIEVTLLKQRVEFDPRVPGIDVPSLSEMLMTQDGTVHVRWSQCTTRTALLHVYDTLAAFGFTNVHPEKKEALEGWDGMHMSTALVTVQPPDTDPAWVICPAGDVVSLGPTFDALVSADHDVYINHVWVILKSLELPEEIFKEMHLHLASELFQRCTNENQTSMRPHVFVRSYRYRGAVAPLLVWYRVHEDQVTCMLQELLHVRFPFVPSTQVCTWFFWRRSEKTMTVVLEVAALSCQSGPHRQKL